MQWFTICGLSPSLGLAIGWSETQWLLSHFYQWPILTVETFRKFSTTVDCAAFNDSYIYYVFLEGLFTLIWIIFMLLKSITSYAILSMKNKWINLSWNRHEPRSYFLLYIPKLSVYSNRSNLRESIRVMENRVLKFSRIYVQVI